MYGRHTVKTNFVGANTQDVDAYFFVLFRKNKSFDGGGDVEVDDKPFHMSSYIKQIY